MGVVLLSSDVQVGCWRRCVIEFVFCCLLAGARSRR